LVGGDAAGGGRPEIGGEELVVSGDGVVCLLCDLSDLGELEGTGTPGSSSASLAIWRLVPGTIRRNRVVAALEIEVCVEAEALPLRA